MSASRRSSRRASFLLVMVALSRWRSRTCRPSVRACARARRLLSRPGTCRAATLVLERLPAHVSPAVLRADAVCRAQSRDGAATLPFPAAAALPQGGADASPEPASVDPDAGPVAAFRGSNIRFRAAPIPCGTSFRQGIFPRPSYRQNMTRKGDTHSSAGLCPKRCVHGPFLCLHIPGNHVRKSYTYSRHYSAGLIPSGGRRPDRAGHGSNAAGA